MAPSVHGGADDDVQSYRPLKATSEGVWQGDNPLHFSLPLLILQICLVLAVTRGLAFALRPLRQPRVIAEITVSSFLIVPRSPSFRALDKSQYYLVHFRRSFLLLHDLVSP